MCFVNENPSFTWDLLSQSLLAPTIRCNVLTKISQPGFHLSGLPRHRMVVHLSLRSQSQWATELVAMSYRVGLPRHRMVVHLKQLVFPVTVSYRVGLPRSRMVVHLKQFAFPLAVSYRVHVTVKELDFLTVDLTQFTHHWQRIRSEYKHTPIS